MRFASPDLDGHDVVVAANADSSQYCKARGPFPGFDGAMTALIELK